MKLRRLCLLCRIKNQNSCSKSHAGSRKLEPTQASSASHSFPLPPCRDGSGCIGGGSGPSPRDASHSQLPSRSPFISRAAADVYSSAAQSKPRVKGGCETLDARGCWVSWCVGCHCLDGSGCGGGSGVGGVFGSRQGTSHSSITSMWCKLALIVGASPSCWQLPDSAVGCIGGGSGPSPRDASHSQLPSRSPFISRAAADVYSSAAQSKPRVKGGCETLDARG